MNGLTRHGLSLSCECFYWVYFSATKSSIFLFVFFNSSRRETSSGNHSDKLCVICATNKARWNAVETHKVFESQEFQSVPVCFKISGKGNLRDASKALRKYAAE